LKVALSIEVQSFGVALLARSPKCSHKIEFSFLNGNLMVPAGPSTIFNSDDNAVVECHTEDEFWQLVVAVRPRYARHIPARHSKSTSVGSNVRLYQIRLASVSDSGHEEESRCPCCLTDWRCLRPTVCTSRIYMRWRRPMPHLLRHRRRSITSPSSISTRAGVLSESGMTTKSRRTAASRFPEVRRVRQF
jgi:hypothetical protein